MSSHVSDVNTMDQPEGVSMLEDVEPRRLRALDLFAGTGWGVACRWLGIEEFGVEIMPEAVATREANGMQTIYRDVWDGLEGREDVPDYDILIASPPCQTFSLAGKGSGRKALDDVIAAINDHLYKDPEQLREFGELHDPRTALVLAPLAHVFRDRPRFVVLEQVPTVQPVWEAYAGVMRDWGYTVDTAVLSAEQYGVPQTRRRSILVAHLDGPIALPVPTHSKYYSRTPTKLDEGVLPWISMAEALGWLTGTERGLMDRPSPTVTGGGVEAGGAEPIAKFRERYTGLASWVGGTGRLATAEAAALQSYPSAVKSMGAGMVERYGDRPGREATQPAFTLRASAGGTEPGGFRFEQNGATRKLEPVEAATLQSYPPELRQPIRDWKWRDAPATTIAGDPRITAREHHYHGEQSKTSLRLTQEEANTLQTFPPAPFTWCGTKTKVFLQIGNAVPPVLAAAVLRSVLASDAA